MSRQTPSAITRVLNVAVPVSDHDRALGFYRDVLGLEVRRDAPFGPGLRWVEVGAPGAETTVALAPHREGTSIGVDTGIRLGTRDADASHRDLAARGVDVGAEVMRFGPGVPAMFFLRDPDGNQLVIVEDAA
ncbi:MAG TPA: VOC family protein [Candidatus Binatia bacterium]|nr:VOC family protein [Candidatus Binatia bacterium]